MYPRLYFYFFLLLLIVVFGIINYTKLTKPYKLLTFLIIYTFISEVVARALAITIKNSCPPYHLYGPVQFFFLSIIYSKYLTKYKKLLQWNIVVFIILAAINLIFFQKITEVPSNVSLLSCVYFTALSLVTYAKMLKQIEPKPLTKQPLFWFNTAVLLLSAITFFYWSFYNYSVRNNFRIRSLGTFIFYVNILYYTAIGYAIYLDATKKRIIADEYKA